MDIVKIDVGGTIFSTRLSTLKALPETRLGKLSTSSAEYIKEKDYFYFDRNPDLFQNILDIYRHGDMHVPSYVCGATLKRELKFWQIPLSRIQSCCLATICKYEDTTRSTKNLKTYFAAIKDEDASAPDSRMSSICVVRRHIWRFLTVKNSSLAAKIYNVFYYLMVCLSVLVFILATHPAFRQPPEEDSLQSKVVWYVNWLRNVSAYTNDTSELDEITSNPKFYMYWSTQLTAPLRQIDTACLFFFILELFVRILTCPNLLQFMKSLLNFLDILVVLALTIAFILPYCGDVIFSSDAMFWFFTICKSMAVLRSVRLFRLTRDVGAIRILTLAVKTRIKELMLLGTSVMVAIVLFSSVIYFAEMHKPNSQFTDIPTAIWSGVITVSTVGYGDVTPSTVGGYVIASFCALSGILLLAMPMALVVSEFSELRFLNQVREREEEIKTVTEMAQDSSEKRLSE